MVMSRDIVTVANTDLMTLQYERSSWLIHNLSNCKTAPNSYGFIAQLVEHCTGIAEVTGSNPAEARIFFRLPFCNC